VGPDTADLVDAQMCPVDLSLQSRRGLEADDRLPAPHAVGQGELLQDRPAPV
jgi:hypothetical protein